MKQITERLAEALRQCEAAFSDIFAQCASNGMKNAWGHPVDHTQLNKANCMTGSVLREYDRLRTHPAEGGEGRDDEATLACPRCDRRRTTGAGRLPDWPACCNLVCHCTCHNDPLYCRECKDCDCHKAALPPQPVAPERGEAKAVAPGNGSFQIGWYNTKYKAFFKMDEQDSTGRTHEMLLDGEIIRVYANATPQPPPAPTFRDPTIEDLQAARLFIEQYEREHPEADDDELGIAALNAIGAKVEEK